MENRCSNIRPSTSTHSRRRRDWHAHSKMSSCCLMVAGASTILFRVNWRLVIQVFHVRRNFNSHDLYVWPEANPLTLYQFSIISNSLRVNVWVGNVREFFIWPYLLPPTAHCTGLPGVCGGKATWNTGGNPLGTREKRVVPARRLCCSLCTSGPRTSLRHVQRSLDWTGLARGLASQVTGPHTSWTFSYEVTLKSLIFTPPFYYEENIVALLLRQWRQSSL